MLRYGVAVGTAVAGWTLADETRRDRVTRVARTGIFAIQVASVYKWKLHGLEKNSDEYNHQLKSINEMAAKKMLSLCYVNKGIYTKLGQHIASMNHVLPPEITGTLVPLQDQALPVPYNAIESVVKAELGIDSVSDLFSSFDETPVAAASLAQVHKAVLKSTDTPVAVKVQYPSLTHQLSNDLWTMKTLMAGIEYVFKEEGFNLQWILPEFEKVVSEELDFEKEAGNAKRVARIFQRNRRVYVPKIFGSSTRVLIMEYIKGAKITDSDKIREMRLNPKDIAKIVSEAFAHMICCDGFVHCDPHPGNIFVRKNMDGSPQIVLLDHGLYRDLDEGFRRTFCQLWKSLLTRDEELLKSCAASLGAAQYYNFFPMIFTYRSLSSRSKLGESMNESDKEKLRAELKKLRVNDVSSFMQFLPRDMLYVFRITNLVRSLNKDLGGTGKERFLIMGKHAIEGGSDSHSTLSFYLNYTNLTARLWMIDFSISMFQLYNSVKKYICS